MTCLERRRDVVEGVRQRAGDPVLVEVRGAGLDVAGVCLQPLVVSRSDPVAKDVNRLGLAGEAGGQLLGDEAVGTAGQLEAAVDRVVVGDRDEVHAAPLGELILPSSLYPFWSSSDSPLSREKV